METPAWLSQRDGAIKLSSDGSTWLMLLGSQPQYSLRLVPVQGKHGCAIKQTNNGRPMDSPGVYSSPEEALRGGLEDIRRTLGW